MSALYELAQVIEARKEADPESSWTAKLLHMGPEYAARKFGEEALESVIEAVRGDREALLRESADAVYHLLVMLAAHDLRLQDVEAELARRAQFSGIEEKAARSPL